MTRVGKLVQKNGIKQMIKAYPGVIQPLFELNEYRFYRKAK